MTESAVTVEPAGVSAEAATETGPQRSLLAQLREWLATVPDDHPYGDLARLAREAGWDWLLRQEDVQTSESVITVTFGVLIGRVGMDAARFEYVDRATFVLPARPGPASVGARMQIGPTIIYMLFGRLPPADAPAATAPAPTEQVVEMADEDVELDAEPVRHMNGADDIAPLVTGADVPPWTPGAGLPDVVVERIDGVPVFADLDDVQAPSGDVIVAVTNEVNSALVKMTSADQVLAFWNQNEAVFGWLQDFATPEQRAAIRGAFARRKGQIEGGFADVAPRRRAAN